jgi:hypothetical protein
MVRVPIVDSEIAIGFGSALLASGMLEHTELHYSAQFGLQLN